MRVAPDTLVTRHPDILGANIADGLALMSIERGSYFDVNPVGRAIWEAIVPPASPLDISARLTTTYDIGAEQCLQEVLVFLDSLLEKGLAVVVEREHPLAAPDQETAGA